MVIKQKDTNKIALKLLEESSDDFITRDYQINLIETSMKNSIAICSDNENIKYFIMIALIKKYLKIQSKYILILLRDESKIKFLTDVIERHCDVCVHNIQAIESISEHRNQIVNIVNYDRVCDKQVSVWQTIFDNVSLLIVDDCHAVLDSDGRLKSVLELCSIIANIHLLGLNSAIINKMNMCFKLEQQIQEMETILHCHVDIGSQSYVQACILNTIEEEHLFYDHGYKDSTLSELVRRKLNSSIDFLNDVEELYSKKGQLLDPSEDLYAYCLNSCLKCKEILDDLGIWCCCIVARAFIRHLLRLSKTRFKSICQELTNHCGNLSTEDEIGRILRNTTSLMSEIVRICTVTFDGMSNYEEFQQVMSPKVRKLVDKLKTYMPSLNFKIEAVRLPNLLTDSSVTGSLTPASSQESLDLRLDDYESDNDFDTSDDESIPTDDENPSVDRGGPTFRAKSFTKKKRSKRSRSSVDYQTKNSANKFLFRAVIPDDNNKTADVDKFNKLCCLIYVNCSFTAYALSRFLDELCVWDPDLFFLHPSHVFTVSGSPNEPSNIKSSGTVSMGQEETINNFRKGIVNCLITTQILDTAKFDLQKCNLVVRFDPIQNLQQYFNTKSRAGVTTNAATMLRKANSSVAEAICHMTDKRKAKMIHFISESNKQQVLNNLSDFYNVEQGIINRFNKISGIKNNELNTKTALTESQIDAMQASVTSRGLDAKEITLSRAISLVNLYCARLPTDSFTKLTSDCQLETREEAGSKLYKCQLQLPINSPHRLITTGIWMPSIKLAKMSAALLTMDRLYQLQEVDNQFYPWNKEDNRAGIPSGDSDKNDESCAGILGGSSKCRHCYSRLFAKCISTAPIRPMHPSYLYSIDIVLSRAIPEEQNLKGRKIMISQNEEQGFGLLCGETGLENTLTFPVFTRSGEEEVNFVQLTHDKSDDNVWLFSEEQFNKIKLFHHIMITSVFRLKLDKGMVLDLENAHVKLLIVPINKALPESIDWDFMDLVIRSYNSVENVCRLETRRKVSGMFDFQETDYRNAVVMPSYRNIDHRQYYYVADICWDMRPTTDFPGENFSTFAEYYTKKYQAKITNYQQPLLDADFSVMRLNLTTPRHVNFKGVPLPVPSEAKKKFFRESMTQKQFLIPELCYIHPFSATLWHKAACLPTVLHRVNQLLLAEELRSMIAHDTGLGPTEFCMDEEKLLMDYNLSGGLRQEDDNNLKNSSVIGINLNETKIVEDMGELRKELDENNLPRSDSDFGEFRHTEFLGENEREYFESNSDVESVDSFEDDRLLFLPEEDDIQYDQISKNTFDNCRASPSPSIILESITMLSVSDFVNLERMETVGDSFLKYASTVYNFLKYPYAHEGRLSFLRSKQVSNSNLFVKAKEKNLAGYLNSQKFNPQDNWMLPGYMYKQVTDVSLIINESYANFSPRIQHFLSDKNIADVVESLTGCYLTTRGEISALRLLQWFNIDCIPIDGTLLPNQNGARATDQWIKPKTPLSGLLDTEERRLFYCELIDDLEGLETIIGYKFNEKAYLLQAMTHSSFYMNTFTDCYQRLELLGDAVLDYVITRFLYEDCRRHSPGDLTDLRSALVNNNIFAALVVRFNVHKFFKCVSPDLWRLIDKFVFYQKDVMKDDLDFVIHQETRQGHMTQDDSLNIDEDVEIPKCLGDIFESLAGAIYLDCGMDLNTVWRIFHPLFRERIERYTSIIPKSPVRQLLELMPEIVNFEFPKRTADGKTRVCVRVIGKGRFYGIGRNYRIAKSVAAKKALRKLLVAEQQ